MPKTETHYQQITLNDNEGLLLGSLVNLGLAQLHGDVEAQEFFIRSTTILARQNTDDYRSLAKKIIELANNLPG
jgi:hypothetical protein